MNLPAHLSFGAFTGLAAYALVHDWVAAAVVLIGQIGLILDFLIKRMTGFEPLHTVVAMLIIWTISYLLFPDYHIFVLFAYFTHLFLDIFVYDEIPLLWPSQRQLMYPVAHSELFVIIVSMAGIILIVTLLFL